MTAKARTKVSQITVRGLDPEVVERLKQRARLAGRSMEEEARAVLTKGTAIDPEELMERARKLAAEIGDHGFDSVQMIRDARAERDLHLGYDTPDPDFLPDDKAR